MQQQCQQQDRSKSGGANLSYMTWQHWRKQGRSNVNTTTTAEEQNWIDSNCRVVARQQRDGSNSYCSDANLYLWQWVRQDGSNGCDNTVAERTWLGDIVSNRNGSSERAETVTVIICIIGPGGSGGREAAATSKQ